MDPPVGRAETAVVPGREDRHVVDDGRHDEYVVDEPHAAGQVDQHDQRNDGVAKVNIAVCT
jgi:hypothetical protein